MGSRLSVILGVILGVNFGVNLGRFLITPFPDRMRVGPVTPLCLSSKFCDHPTLERLLSDEDMVLGFPKPDAILIFGYISQYISPNPLHLYLGQSGGLASNRVVAPPGKSGCDPTKT
jgi:hypothetical protein